MNLSLILYLVFVLGTVSECFKWMGGTLFIISLFSYVITKVVSVHAIDREEMKPMRNTNKVFKKLLIVFAIMTSIGLLTPSKEEIAMIYVMPKISQNKDIKEIPANIAKLANEGLKELIEGLKKIKED